jgi:hypothetical protein
LIEFSSRIDSNVYHHDFMNLSLCWCKMRPMMLQICLMISLIDQYLSTNYHYNLRQMSTRQLAERLTLVYMCFWILHSIPFGIFYEIQPSICCEENLEEVLWKDMY